MFQQFNIRIQYKSRERQILNALLALVTGILTLVYPNFLYLIAGGYLLALGLTFIYFRTPTFIAAIPILTAVLIFIFPELIPITFAVFLGLFGLLLLLSFGFIFMGILTLIIAGLIVNNPDSVAILIAAFLLLYAFSNLIRLYQDRHRGNGHKPDDENEVYVQ